VAMRGRTRPGPSRPTLRDVSDAAAYPSEWESDVVLRDGGTVRLRPMRRDDGEHLLQLYSRLSDESLYLRFFSPVPAPTARDLELLTATDYDRRFAIVAELGEEVVAVARSLRLPRPPESAEIAFTVEDDQQGRGLGTVMLEHLAAIAREKGIRRFVASTMTHNTRMLGVFADAGFDVNRTVEGGVVEVSFDIEPTDASRQAQHHREQVSEARSVVRILAPTSVAVVGASRHAGTIGYGVLTNLLDGGFKGPVYPVNPNAASIADVPAFPTVDAVPGPVDLAVVCVPAPSVPAVVDDCVRKGVQGLVVISAGFAEVDAVHGHTERDLVERARRNGMRMIGPNCMGVVNTNPAVAMNATFAPFLPVVGRVGFASQSGGLGIALLARSAELGLGISTFVSLGNKADLSSNDLLQYWEEDPETDVILLYLESFGNPRKFARLARRVSRHKPIIAVKSGRSTAGARGTSSHTAALAAPDAAVDALFAQAGVIRVDTLEELYDTAAVVLHQPLPPGRRVSIVTNGGGPGILAADACAAAGLEVPELSDTTQARLRTFVLPDAGVRNPVDLIASASAEIYERTLDTLIEDPDIDALLVIFVPPLVTQPEEVAAVINAAAGRAGDKPVIACFLGRQGMLEMLGGDTGGGATAGTLRRVPSFAFPEAAAAALGRAAAHQEWRRRPEGEVPTFADARIDLARRMVADRLASTPDGEWLDAATATGLLQAMGIPAAGTAVGHDVDAAVARAEELGFPVVLKAASPSILHKTERGAVRLGLRDATAVREAFAAMHDALGEEMGGAILQKMVEPGVETIVGVTRDPSFGSLVLFGMGGVQAELLRDTALRIVPLTDVDASEMIRSLRSSALLFGFRGSEPVDSAALEEVLVRVGLLAEHVPEIAELDCNPVVVSPQGAVVVDVKVRLAPVPLGPPPGVRRLRDA
jgi:acetyl coenzyme A synthetase (ADP forming)-like protein